MTNIPRNVDIASIETAIRLLTKNIKETSINPLIAALEALKEDPYNGSRLVQVSNAFKALGVVQGAVLTHAPYVNVLLTHDIFGDD